MRLNYEYNADVSACSFSWYYIHVINMAIFSYCANKSELLIDIQYNMHIPHIADIMQHFWSHNLYHGYNSHVDKPLKHYCKHDINSLYIQTEQSHLVSGPGMFNDLSAPTLWPLVANTNSLKFLVAVNETLLER